MQALPIAAEGDEDGHPLRVIMGELLSAQDRPPQLPRRVIPSPHQACPHLVVPVADLLQDSLEQVLRVLEVEDDQRIG